MKDGYGINEHLIRYAYEEGVDTILTCDNGIAAVEQTKLAKSLGMTILITDHHEVQEEIPPADAVVNPRQADCPYPFKHLCGAAVAYKVICCLYEAYGIPKEETEEFLEFAGFATVGDVMDLIGENRILVKEPYTECRDGIPDPCLRTGRKRDQILPYRVCTGTVHQRWRKTGHCKTLSEPAASERQGKGRCDGGRTENT